MPPKKRMTADVDRVEARITGEGLKPPLFTGPAPWHPHDKPITRADVGYMAAPGCRIPTEAELVKYAAQLEAERVKNLAERSPAERARRLAHVRHMMSTPRVTESEKRQWLAAGLIDEQGHILRDDGSGFDPVQPEQPRSIPNPTEPYDLAGVEHGATWYDAEERRREHLIREAAARPAELFDPRGE